MRATVGAGDEGSRAGRAQPVVASGRPARSPDDGAGAGLGGPGGRRERVSREESSQMVGPLKNVAPLGGVTVLDFTQIELGPCATQVLGDFGADVIKIERPGAGDLSRVHMKHASGESAVFWSLNRNKRSVAIDVRAPLGREAIYRLARKAPVFRRTLPPR